MQSFRPFGVPWCGCWFATPNLHEKKYLPQVQLDVHTIILASVSKTTLRQTFQNPQNKPIFEAVYTFPLYDGVSIAGFSYSIAGRTAVGVVKEKERARQDYENAKANGRPVGLLEQSADAADVFTTSIGNIPAGENVLVEITYLGELKNDAETDAVRFTIPTNIAPRYGAQTVRSMSELQNISSKGMKISVDIMLEEGSAIRGIQSPSHLIAMSMGRTGAQGEEDDSFKNNLGSATLMLPITELDKDFILLVSAKGLDIPKALLETHPIIPNQRALLATLVPKFDMPQDSPEIVFVVDRSGSMGGKMHLVIDALKVFLKSLPVGVKFNICSFGSMHGFLFQRSKTYDATSLKEAMEYINPTIFQADLGGTEMMTPVEDVLKRRYHDLPLEVMLMTDGEIWNQDALFQVVNGASKQNARFFTLGIGASASSALVEGIARAGRGFSQSVSDGERIDKRIVRMLKGALSPHIEYKLEVRYAHETSDEDDFEIIDSFEKNTKSVVVTDAPGAGKDQEAQPTKKKISLFSSKKRDEPKIAAAGRYDHLPSISTPTVLQTPHDLPELYPHSRTSVYLLLASETSGLKPEAVILRGISKNEELELEIPIQDVGQGETIHKLATKKATQELEEGRGWLTALRTADGETLQSQNEGKWDLIVEREAVRLCTKFQVAGRHCSFIAVERTDQDTSATTKKTSEVVLLRPLSFYQRYPDASQPKYRKSLNYSTLRGGAVFGNAPGAGLFGNSSPAVSSSSAATGFGSASFGAPAPSARKRVVHGLQVANFASSRGMSSFAAPPGASFGASMAQQKETYSATPFAMSTNHAEAEDESYEAVSVDANEMSPLDKMQRLITLQSFTGSWSASNEFLTIISHSATTTFSRLDIKQVVTEFMGANGKSSKEWAEDLTNDDYATVVAIAWLETVMKDESDVWEMVVEKARGYLEGRVDGSDQVNELIEDVRSLWTANS